MSARDRGNAAFKAKDFLEAKQLYTAALLEEPLNAAVWCNRSAVHLALQCPHFAATDAIRALDIDADFAKAHFRLGCAFAQMSGFKQAVRYFESCLRLAPDMLVEKKLREAKYSLEQGPTELQLSCGHDGKYSSFYCPPATSRAPMGPDRLRELNQVLGQKALVQQVEIRPSPGHGGLGLYTASDCGEAGALLLHESPLLALSYRPERCAACAEPLGDGAVACETCLAERYCCESCRSAALGRYHRAQCGAVARDIAALRSKMHELAQSEGGRIPNHYHVLAALRVAGIVKQDPHLGGVSAHPEFRDICSLTD